MFLLMLLAASTSTAPPQPSVSSRAIATVRVLQSSKASREEWERVPADKRREVIRSEGGRQVLIRIVDHE